MTERFFKRGGQDDFDYWTEVWERLPDGTERLIGQDGGEPEDQTLGRDWAWVVPALNAAYEAGRASTREGKG